MVSTGNETSFILSKITEIFTSFSISLSTGSALTITVLSRTSTARRPRTLQFPGRTLSEAHIFTCTLKLLSIIRTLLTSSQIATKRDIYYRNTALFRSQAVVDRLVDDIAATFGVRRRDLGITAAAKGLVRGAVAVVMKDGTVLHAMTGGNGVLIPEESPIESFQIGPQVNCIVIVEKEAVFRTLCSLGSKEYVYITGKGYPDVSTREFIVQLAERVGQEVPIVALVDMDPHGIEIAATYKFGSLGMVHDQHNLVCKRIQWLGVKTRDLSEVVYWDIHAVAGENDGTIVREKQEGLIPLTERDRKKALQMLKKTYIERLPGCRTELQRLLFFGLKAEIEILGDRLQHWLDRRVKENSGEGCEC